MPDLTEQQDPKPPTDRAPASAFADRHIGPDADEQAEMLAALGFASLDELVADAVPAAIRQAEPLDLPAAASEESAAAELAALAGRNRVVTPDDRPRLPRHGHAAGHPAQRAREPGLVHRVHAVPAGDLPGPARGARRTSRRWWPT